MCGVGTHVCDDAAINNNISPHVVAVMVGEVLGLVLVLFKC